MLGLEPGLLRVHQKLQSTDTSLTFGSAYEATSWATQRHSCLLESRCRSIQRQPGYPGTPPIYSSQHALISNGPANKSNCPFMGPEAPALFCLIAGAALTLNPGLHSGLTGVTVFRWDSLTFISFFFLWTGKKAACSLSHTDNTLIYNPAVKFWKVWKHRQDTRMGNQSLRICWGI